MKGWVIIGLATVGIGGLVGWRINAKKTADAEVKSQAGQNRGASVVEVTPAVQRTIFDKVESIGNVESPDRIVVSPNTTGRISFINLREGDPVAEGQVILKLDPTEAQAAVVQQQANVAEARSRLAQAKINAGPAAASVQNDIESQRANVTSSQADLQQLERNLEAQIASANAVVVDAQAKLRGAQAAVTNAQAEVERQQANLRNVQARADRATELHAKGFISSQELDNAVTALDVQKGTLKVSQGQLAAAKTAVESAQAQLSSAQKQAEIVTRKSRADITSAKARVDVTKSGLKLANANQAQNPAYKENIAALTATVQAAEAQLNQSRARLNDLIVRSPIKGTVTARTGDVGGLASPGTAVLEIQSVDLLFVKMAFPLELSSRIRPGLVSDVTFDALPGRTFPGTIASVNYAADPATRQFSALIKLKNDQKLIRPGMFAKVAVQLAKFDNAVVVPREAVKTTKQGSTVTVIDADKKAHVRIVELGFIEGGNIQIKKGVSAGESVVVLSFAPLREDQQVAFASDAKKKEGGPNGGTGGGPGGGDKRPEGATKGAQQ